MTVPSPAFQISVNGTVSTSNGPVRYAQLTFIPQADTLSKCVTLTDTLGNYRVTLLTAEPRQTSYSISMTMGDAYPNPFSSATLIDFFLPHPSDITATIYNIVGQTIKVLSADHQSQGKHSLTWDGTDRHGSRVVPGIYFCQLRTAFGTSSRKMILAQGLTRSPVPFDGFSYPGQSTSRVQGGLTSKALFSVLLEPIESTIPPFATTLITGVALENGQSPIDFIVNEINDFVMCYERPDGGVGQIYLNNIRGTHPCNISHYTARSDIAPQWSPDGRYIAFRRGTPAYGPKTICFDLLSSTFIDLTSDGGISASLPQWTPDGGIYFAYERPVLSPPATYLMRPDGSDKMKILDTIASQMWSLGDSRRFVFQQKSGVYLLDPGLDTVTLIVDFSNLFGQSITVQDFNPSDEELLFTYYSLPDSTQWIATYSILTHLSNQLCSALPGYTFYQTHYSTDGSMIAFIEHGESDEYLSILKNGSKERLVCIPTGDTIAYFSYEPLCFSRDGRFIAYSDMVFGTGQYVNFTQHLYVVEIATKSKRLIDVGWHPSWSPR
jgi:Tol biopolymer transport system component